MPSHFRGSPAHLDCDVLVLGAGLAGMRAAWAAKAANPRLNVLLLSPRIAPSGSSFANRNNALGLQAPQEAEAEAFEAEVLRLALPGLAVPALVRALAQDAQVRVSELLALGLQFLRHPDGTLRRFPGCFSLAPRAVIFCNLAKAHAAILAQVRSLGVTLLHGFEAVELLRAANSGRICGARLCALRGHEGFLVTGRTVIAALGGPAPLYANRLCGPGTSGLAYGLLAQAKAHLVNTRFLQFFWVRARDRAFLNPGDLPWPEALQSLAAFRRCHCPISHGLPDTALDLDLLARRDAKGLVRLPGQEPLVLAAHAGNGGALITEHGRTSAPGLYACGECAGGMHGANRLGGGMVLSALVFGARAGAAAAQEAAGMSAAGRDASLLEFNATAHGPKATSQDTAAFLRRLRRGMQRVGLPGDTPGLNFLNWLKVAAQPGETDQRQRLLALSALAVLEGNG